MLRKIRDLAVAGVALLLATSGTALAQTPTGEPTPAPVNPTAAPATAPLVSDPEYRLGDGDIIDVMVVGSSDFNTRGRVSNDGAILLPLVGAIAARGDTPAGLADKVGAALKKGGYYPNPVVRVELAGIRSRYVTVLGAVGSPGLIPLDRSYRLSEIIARVAGRAGGGGADYVILTPTTGEGHRYKISDLATKGGADDPIVQAGDKIYIPPLDNEVFYFTGEVKKPGPQAMSPELTLRIALAVAGGVTENGSEKKFSIVRKGEKLKGATLETKLEPGDIVTFGAKMF